MSTVDLVRNEILEIIKIGHGKNSKNEKLTNFMSVINPDKIRGLEFF